MKKIILFVILIIFILFGGLFIYKKWQFKQMGYSQPKRETIKDIIKIHKNKIGGGKLVTAKDQSGYYYLNKYCGLGSILIFNSQGQLVESNFSNLGGKCFADIQHDLCNNAFKPNQINDLNGKISLDSFLAKIVIVEPNDTISHRKYTIIFSWVNYVQMSLNKKNLKFINCLIDNQEYEILAINLDYNSTWYPKNKEIPKHIFK